MKHIAILTSGGDASGMNAAVCAVCEPASTGAGKYSGSGTATWASSAPTWDLWVLAT
jgi:hypothetical protein